VTSHKWHNEMATDIIERLGHGLLDHKAGFADLMVLVENIMLGSMMLNVQFFELPPHVAAGLMEEALATAVERFTAEIQKAKRNRA
jgi:hypothetical protein